MSTLEESAKRLAESAAALNNVSDALNDVIAELNEGFKKLNLGIEAIAPATDTLSIAYGKTNSRWGVLVIRTTNAKREVWHFSEAPRALRLETVDALPKLLDAMTKAAVEKAWEIGKAVERAKQFTEETR